MIAGGIISLVMLIRSNIRFRKKQQEAKQDTLFQTILSTEDKSEVWPLLNVYINEKQRMFLQFAAGTYSDVTSGFINDNTKLLSRSEKALVTEKDVLKGQRRKLTLCMRQLPIGIAMEKNTWFHLSNNMAMSMTYSLRRINEVCKEHVDNNFRPLPSQFHDKYTRLCEKIRQILLDSDNAIEVYDPDTIDALRTRCDKIKDELTYRTREVYELLQKGDASDLTVAYVYLNVLQESQEFITSLRKMLRAVGKLNLAPTSYRSFSHHENREAY